MSDLILKEILGISGTKNAMKEQIEEYKLTEREIFGKFDNLSEDELSSKWNEKVYVRNDAMTSVINRCRGKKKNVKKKKRKTDGFKQKLMIPESDTSECQNVQNLKSNKKYETYL